MIVGGMRGRMTLQLVMAAVVILLLTSLAFFTLDVSPSFSKVLNKMENLEGAVKERLNIDVMSTRHSAVDGVVVSLDQIMKAPVSLNQDDPRLIQRIRAKYLHPPSTQSYSLASTNADPSMGQSKQIRLLLGDKVMFKQSFNVGKISNLETGHNKTGYAEVQCLPLYSILLALNTTTIDYFSLDVEGAEMGVLKTIPWEKVDIKTLSVEFIHGGEGKDAIRKYMEGVGYVVFSEVTHPGWLANDFIFAKKELLAHRGEGNS